MAKRDKDLERIRRYWEASQRLREGYDIIWEMCLRKYAGQHWMTYNHEHNRFYPMRRGANGRKMTLHRTNMIRKDVDILKWVLVDNLPHPTARPGPGHGPQDDKALICNYTSGFLSQMWDTFNHEDLYEDIALSILTLGNSYQRPFWNPNDPRSVVPVPVTPELVEETVPETSTQCLNCGALSAGQQETCPVCGMGAPAIDYVQTDRKSMVERTPTGPDGQPMTVNKPIGNIGLEHIPAHEIYFPRMASNIKNAGYLWRLRYAPVGWVRKVSGNPDVAPQPIDATQIYTWQINTITGSSLQFDMENEDDTSVDDMAPFLEYWEKPNPEAPKGHYLLFTDFNFEKIVKETDYPVEASSPLAESFGLIHDVFTKVSGRFLGAGKVEDLYPINNQHNSEITQLDYMRTRFLNAKIITYVGSDVTEAKMNADSDTVQCNSPQQKPESLQIITPIPQLIQHVQVTLNRFREMSGVSQTMEGAQPGSIRANSAIASLTQQAILPVVGVKKRMLRNMQKLYTEVLRLAQKHYTPAHELDVMGAGGDIEFMKLKGADLNKPGAMVWVDIDKAYPTSKQEEREAFEKLLQYSPDIIQQQAMADPAFFQTMLELMGLDREKYNVQYNIQAHAAQIEVEEFLATGGQTPLEVDPLLDNHMMHAYTHEKLLLSDRGRKMKQEQPQFYMMIKQHYALHKQTLQQQMMAQQPPPQGPPPQGAPKPKAPQPPRR